MSIESNWGGYPSKVLGLSLQIYHVAFPNLIGYYGKDHSNGIPNTFTIAR